MPQCPCAELFKIGDDYTREHHELCTANNDGRIFAPTTPPGQKPEWWGVESSRDFAAELRPLPTYQFSRYSVNLQGDEYTLSANAYCDKCGLEHTIKRPLSDVEWICEHTARVFVKCPRCETAHYYEI